MLDGGGTYRRPFTFLQRDEAESSAAEDVLREDERRRPSLSLLLVPSGVPGDGNPAATFLSEREGPGQGNL